MDEHKNKTQDSAGSNEFEQKASERNAGLLTEIWLLIAHNKKWWLIPVILMLLAIGVLVILGSSAAATFIYPLF